MNKVSIRFYNNQEVRAIWKDDESMWYLAIVDVVAAITRSAAPRKYWSVLKTRLKKQGNELATNCSQLKLMATDGKRYNTDCISQSSLTELVKNQYLEAMRMSVADDSGIRSLLRGALTDDINSREMFMKGIDFSYYYEQED